MELVSISILEGKLAYVKTQLVGDVEMLWVSHREYRLRCKVSCGCKDVVWDSVGLRLLVPWKVAVLGVRAK